MNLYLKLFGSFMLGGVVGAGTAYIFLKKRYEQINDDTVESLKRAYEEILEKRKGEEKLEILAEINREKPDLNEYTKQTQDNHTYVDYTKMGSTTETELPKEEVKNDISEIAPDYYVISPDEFGEFENYARISFTYYADGILADENDEIMEEDDIENCIGLDFADHFGEFAEEDSAYFRNDRLKSDYEILADIRTFKKAEADKRLISDY